jgi:AcrR family transcriptional regulator
MTVARTTNLKNDQRARLLRAMAEVVAREGYALANIAQAISLARVSRTTFYEHFEDKLDCFLAVERELAANTLASVEQALAESTPEEVTQTIVRTLVQLAEQDPIATRVLMAESLAAGPPAMDERDAMVDKLAGLVEQSWAELPDDAPVLDIPARALVGGTCRLLSIRILRGASGIQGLLPDLLTWVHAYTRTAGEPKWRELIRKGAPLPPSPHAEVAQTEPPTPLPPGRHKLPASYVSSNRRERILQATTTTLLRKGYAATTVADIVAEAQLTRATFYQHFRDKQEVLTEINQNNFQVAMGISARAFFSDESWPERVWQVIHATGEFNAENPGAAQIGFIETSAVGPEFARRINDTIVAFALFLEEGYRFRPEADQPPRLSSEVLTSALCELAYWEIRRQRPEQFRDLVPHVTYVALAPFMGPEAASEFVEEKVRELQEGRQMPDSEQTVS